MDRLNHDRLQDDADEIEAIIADAIAAEAAAARREAAPPSSAIVWWRAQMRARQEAARAVERPLTIVHTVAIASGIGLFLSIVGTAMAGMKGSFGWLANIYTSVTAPGTAALVGSWMALPMTAMVVMVVVVSLAALFIYAGE